MNKEIELKYLLSSKEDLLLLKQTLLPYVKQSSLLIQENFYFDTPGLSFRKEGISLRLRKENQKYLLTAKQSLSKKKGENNLSVRLEYEGSISKEVGELIASGYLSPLESFAALSAGEEATKKRLFDHMKKASKLGLQLWGSFINHRTAMPLEILGHHVVLELDHSFYPKNVEIFEVEVEFLSIEQAEVLRPLIEDLFRKIPIKTFQSISKSSRLYHLLTKS